MENTSVRIDGNNCFLALAAPSMDGKTQFAFTCEQVKPLYFSLSKVDQSSLKTSQPILLNYRALAKALHNCAVEDLKMVGNVAPSLTRLQDEFSGAKFQTLGFLKELIDLGAFTKGSDSWMTFHSHRPDFLFGGATIAEMKGQFKGFILFLDEFNISKENTLLRNLARAVDMPCIVANTNTKIANLGGSGSNKHDV